MQQKIDLDAIRAREQAATPGPWMRKDTAEYAEIYDSDTWGKALIPLALVAHEENAIFIAHARQDIPALLAEVERLQALLDRAQIERCAPTNCPHANTVANMTRRGLGE